MLMQIESNFPPDKGPLKAGSEVRTAKAVNSVNELDPGELQGVPVLTRLFEIPMAIVALIVTAPVMLFVATVVWWGTPGPVLFRQQRLGIGARPFSFYKFRTMYADARTRFPELYAYDYTPGDIEQLYFKVEDDPRVTPQGQWLRRLSIDELPNFWCVLKGDMALVGPRPEIPEMLRYYDADTIKKFSVRPGVTGLAQISGRGRLSFNDTVACDLEYVRTRSFMLDMKILFKTVWMVLVRHGAF